VSLQIQSFEVISQKLTLIATSLVGQQHHEYKQQNIGGVNVELVWREDEESRCIGFPFVFEILTYLIGR